MKQLWNWVEDQILDFIQRGCEHPSKMVAADILEGCGNWEVAYCRRCGAVRLKPDNALAHEWRRPIPNLWRGYVAREAH